MKITIRRPDDMHVHFRDGAMMEAVVPETARHFARALVMPNVPAIESGRDSQDYWSRICDASPGGFTPLMTIKLTHRTTQDDILDARSFDVMACKLYPSGVTTGSHDGISDVSSLWPVFDAMQRCGMVLCVHGESPGAFVLDREEAYLGVVAGIVRNFPGLKVVLEHITTRAAVEFVGSASVNVAATITAHHLVTSLDDVLGDGIRAHNFCYPVPKRWEDRSALVSAALYQNGGRYFFGSDSAPHARAAKESACGCAGVFSAPCALAILAGVFLGDEDRPADFRHRARLLEEFTSARGAAFYGLNPNEGTITLERAEWTVPDEVAGVVPFRAGETLSWKVAVGEVGP